MNLNKLKEKQRLELASLEARYTNQIEAVEQRRKSELRSLEERQKLEMSAFEALAEQKNKNSGYSHDSISLKNINDKPKNFLIFI